MLRIVFVFTMVSCSFICAYSQLPRGILEKGVAISYLLSEQAEDYLERNQSSPGDFLMDKGFVFMSNRIDQLASITIWKKETEFGPLFVSLNTNRMNPNLKTVSFRMGDPDLQKILTDGFEKYFRDLAKLGYGKISSGQRMAYFVELSEKTGGYFPSPKESAAKKYPNDPIRSKYGIYVPIKNGETITFGPAIISDDEIVWSVQVYWLLEKLSND